MTSADKRAISSHPAFRWAVAVWFAALLGLGLFVMPQAIHSAIAAHSGLSGVLPGGDADRAIVSGLAAVIGLLLGLAIAGRIAAANRAGDSGEDGAGEDSVWLPDGAAPAEPVPQRTRRVFNPREDIGEDGIDPPDPPADPVAEDEPAAGELAPPPLHEPEAAGDFASSALMEEWREETGALPESVPEPAAPVAPPLAEPSGPSAPHDPAGNEWETPEHSEDATPIAPEPVEPATLETEPLEAALAETTPPPPPPREQAAGDLPLAALTDRLRAALAALRDAEAETAASASEDEVIAFLRREAGRTAPPGTGGLPDDPQAVLRNALDKLSRVSNPK